MSGEKDKPYCTLNLPSETEGCDQNRVFKIFTEGDDLYASMLEKIDDAKSFIWFESYIFANDAIGKSFIDALIRKAKEGVEVKLHLDAAGCRHHKFDFVKDQGIELKYFHRWNWRHPLLYNQRNHRKLLVIDKKIAYLGGFNIHQHNSKAIKGITRWRDTHLQFKGSLASAASWLFEQFWMGKVLKTNQAKSPEGTVIQNTNRRFRTLLKNTIQTAFTQAKQSIYVTTPYYAPDRHTQLLLINAAQRGLDVRLLVPAKSDVLLAQWASQASYSHLLLGGVRIFEYQERMLHAKTVVTDQQWSLVGTANMDYRSFFLNFELNLMSRNDCLAQSLQQQFFMDLKQSKEIQTQDWLHRHYQRYVFEAIGWLMRRWL